MIKYLLALTIYGAFYIGTIMLGIIIFINAVFTNNWVFFILFIVLAPGYWWANRILDDNDL